MNRRELLRWIGAAAVGGSTRRLFRSADDTLLLASPRRVASPRFDPDIDLVLTAAPGTSQILPGAQTQVLRFTGTILKGPRTTLQTIPGSFLGPVIRVRKGQRVRIRFANTLDEPSIVHWHGLDVPEAADGHPRFAIPPGAEYVYEFEVMNRAGTYWYHPHPHGKTGRQVYRGLAGVFVVSDDEEDALALPNGTDDLVCVLQDRTFDDKNQLIYLASGMMDQMHGLLANRMLVNGRERTTLALATRAYRLRVLNGSSSRVYKLVWDDGTPMTVIGSDGGLLSRAVEQRYLTLAPSQRADLILDLSQHVVGTSLQLRSAPFTASEVSIEEGGGGMMAMMGAMGAGSSVPNGAPALLMTVQVARKETSLFRLPARLSGADGLPPQVAPGPTRRITIDFQDGRWQLGGRPFGMTDVAPDEVVAAGSSQVWELANIGGMMGMQMAHPFHVHGTQFQILSRERGPGSDTPVNSVREGLIDAGWRDTVLVMPGETIRLQMRFTKYAGLYLYHCHILEHEDMGMMRNFRVTP
jgi:FtsP/CotA-like multicopper oxidase with cupredoxin domain